VEQQTAAYLNLRSGKQIYGLSGKKEAVGLPGRASDGTLVISSVPSSVWFPISMGKPTMRLCRCHVEGMYMQGGSDTEVFGLSGQAFFATRSE